MKKRELGTIFLIAITILLFVFALGSVGYAGVMQAILSYEKFGVIFGENVFIPHNSAWWFLGGLGFLPIIFLTKLFGG